MTLKNFQNKPKKILITTCRNPSQRTKHFTSEFNTLLFNSLKINRGNIKLSTLLKSCKNHNFTTIIVIHQHSKKPNGFLMYFLDSQISLFFSINEIILRRDINTVLKLNNLSKPRYRIVFINFETYFEKKLRFLFLKIFTHYYQNVRRYYILKKKSSSFIFFNLVVEKNKNTVLKFIEDGPRFTISFKKLLLSPYKAI